MLYAPPAVERAMKVKEVILRALTKEYSKLPRICTVCRYRADDMLWRCPHCHEWNTLVEERVGPAAGPR